MFCLGRGVMLQRCNEGLVARFKKTGWYVRVDKGAGKLGGPILWYLCLDRSYLFFWTFPCRVLYSQCSGVSCIFFTGSFRRFGACPGYHFAAFPTWKKRGRKCEMRGFRQLFFFGGRVAGILECSTLGKKKVNLYNPPWQRQVINSIVLMLMS
ncbi:hypothetical protein BDY21DRAFT_201590 [Lineolata rhizophorae]|uniref:Uncharacterized protein n=1 Tax=Lineolata rhizophorae TaxID=578093 RepID=A0A6A6P522_9PEZI|nr:hypothetical protein BDY21DRAFT_201590 [Lineolata rhizophorae]